MLTSHLGGIASLVTAGCWTVSALSFEAAGKKVGSLAVNLIRLPFAFLLLSLFSLFTRGLPLPVDAPLHAWIWLSLSGFAGLVLGDLFLFRALVVLGSRLSMLIMTLVPVFTSFFGWLIVGETLDTFNFIGMGVTLLGISLVVLEKKNGNSPSTLSHPLSGVFLALGGALGQSMGLVLSKFGMESYNAFAATQIRGIAGTAGFLILVTVFGSWPKITMALKDRRSMRNISLGSFFGPFLGVSFSLLSVQNTKAGVASTIMALVPILIIPPSVLFFRERVTPRELIGAFVAVGGVALLFLL